MAGKTARMACFFFVSHHLLVPSSGPTVRHSDDMGDRSFLCNCRILYHRKLQIPVTRLWKPDCVSPRANITAICRFCKWHLRPTAIVPIIPSQRLYHLRKHIVATELLLGITSALFATLMLQWARICVNLPQIPSFPKERARVRSVLFFGMEKYRMHLAVETTPTLLHLSVFLFFIGLVIFFFTIFKTVAIVILL